MDDFYERLRDGSTMRSRLLEFFNFKCLPIVTHMGSDLAYLMMVYGHENHLGSMYQMECERQCVPVVENGFADKSTTKWRTTAWSMMQLYSYRVVKIGTKSLP